MAGTDRPLRRDLRNPLVIPDRTRQETLRLAQSAMPHRLGRRPAVAVFHLKHLNPWCSPSVLA